MSPPKDPIKQLINEESSRRGALKCLGWVGAGVVWTVAAGIPVMRSLEDAEAQVAPGHDFTFIQISDSHIGFNKPANPETTGSLRAGIDLVIKSPVKPAFLIHTGDVSQLSKPDQFDTADQIIRGAKLDTHYIPGEHDVLYDNGKPFFERFGKETGRSTDKGWFSFDQGGVHFIGLINVVNMKPGGQGSLGAEQLAWVESDLQGRSSSTPIVVFAHVPLWALYPEWGWGTDDSAQLITALKRFGSVTVLNGHIHQVMQKVEGNLRFHTARALAFPQPAPGTAPGPGPMKVPADQLKSYLGITSVELVAMKPPVLTDTTLQA